MIELLNMIAELLPNSILKVGRGGIMISVWNVGEGALVYIPEPYLILPRQYEQDTFVNVHDDIINIYKSMYGMPAHCLTQCAIGDPTCDIMAMLQ